jgi:large subunit ribosomal protein L21
MASTKLQRKARRNISRAKKKVADIQRLNKKPVIKNVDVEEIKKEFSQESTGKKAEKKAQKAEAPKAEKAAAPKADKAGAPKTEKAEAKKVEAPKKEAKAETPKEEAKAESPAGVDVDALLKSVGKADASAKDDLKKIPGVGPAFEKKLNKIGLYTYGQISNLKKADIENLGKMDGVSAEKIAADDWAGTAKSLMEGKKGE